MEPEGSLQFTQRLPLVPKLRQMNLDITFRNILNTLVPYG